MTEPVAPLPPNPALDRLLSEIFIRMRQGKYAEAAARLAQAKELAPEHPAVIEIEGDIAFAKGRFGTARDLYKRALESDPKNGKLEEKFATALLKMMMPQLLSHDVPDDSLWSDRVPRNPVASLFRSLVLPGYGQIFNGELLKGLIVLLAAACTGLPLLYVIISIAYANQSLHRANPLSPVPNISDTLLHGGYLLLLILNAGIWIYGMIDAWYVAKQTK